MVEGLGHCGACHSPRNALGAEKGGRLHLAGGLADGWDAPALTTLGHSPVSWTADAFYDYLRGGHAAHHGGAAGPMAHVVESLRPLPDADIRAMAEYLESLNGTALGEGEAEAAAERALASAAAAEDGARLAFPVGARIFDGACASCHAADAGTTSLALNSNLHGARPDNVIQAILHGVGSPVALAGPQAEIEMAMPAFGPVLSDSQISQLLQYLRATFAPGTSAWEGVLESVAAKRAPSTAH